MGGPRMLAKVLSTPGDDFISDFPSTLSVMWSHKTPNEEVTPPPPQWASLLPDRVEKVDRRGLTTTTHMNTHIRHSQKS